MSKHKHRFVFHKGFGDKYYVTCDVFKCPFELNFPEWLVKEIKELGKKELRQDFMFLLGGKS